MKKILLMIIFFTAFSLTPFFVLAVAPHINSISPTSGPVGQEVTIRGSNFDPNPSDNNVWFYQASASPANQWNVVPGITGDATYFVVRVPQLENTGNVIVSVRSSGGISDNSVSFLVTEPTSNPPAGSECSPPYSGYVGSYTSQSSCEAAAKFCSGSGTAWSGYNSSKVGNSCTIGGTSNQGICDTIGECTLSGACQPLCADRSSWTPLASTKDCGMSFTQTKEIYDTRNCGTNECKSPVSQTAVGTKCSQAGYTCQNNQCVAPSGGSTTPPPSTPSTPSAGGSATIQNPLGYDTFEQILGAITTFIFNVGMVLAPVMLIIAGFLFVTSAGDPKRVGTAKQLALWTLIGLAVLLLASGLVKVLESILGVKGT